MSDTLFVCLMGMGTVFVGLICIIIVCKIVSGIIRLSEKHLQKLQRLLLLPPHSLSVKKFPINSA